MAGANVVTRFGASVRNLRFRLGISQEELANRANLHRTYIAGVEGGTRNITLKSIEKLSNALEVSIPELLSARSGLADGQARPGKMVDILIVEDDANDAALTLVAFRKARIINNIQVLSDGTEALDYLWSEGTHANRSTTNYPRLIFLDINLPKMGGLEILRRIKADARTRHIPVVMLTASEHSRDLAQSRKLGAASYLVKPVDFRALAALRPI